MNQDDKVIEDFGTEWTNFTYGSVDKTKLEENFEEYFSVFPWSEINESSEGFDMGCGSGRWAQFVAPRVKKLNCVEPSQAIKVAKANLSNFNNIDFFNETTISCSILKESQDFGYSLGVLHHIPNTLAALQDCVNLLKPGAPFLVYLYYNFENRPLWFKLLWKASDVFRKVICKLPQSQKSIVCHILAYLIYFPLVRLASLFEKVGFNVESFPLSEYRNKPFYQCKNDALDRFGTRLEQRFSRSDIRLMMQEAGLTSIHFSDDAPYWCCIGYKK